MAETFVMASKKTDFVCLSSKCSVPKGIAYIRYMSLFSQCLSLRRLRIVLTRQTEKRSTHYRSKGIIGLKKMVSFCKDQRPIRIPVVDPLGISQFDLLKRPGSIPFTVHRFSSKVWDLTFPFGIWTDSPSRRSKFIDGWNSEKVPRGVWFSKGPVFRLCFYTVSSDLSSYLQQNP